MIMKDIFLVFLCVIIFILFVLVGVAFFTLLERKVLGYIQLRKGPNKVGYMGLVQPFSDAIKLFTKELVFPTMANLLVFYFCPILGLFISLGLWMCIPFNSLLMHFDYGVLFFFCCSSLGVYFIMLAGWSSNSNYSLLGSLRSVAQAISYEVSMALVILSFLLMIWGFNLIGFLDYQVYVWFLFLSFPLSMVMFVSLLAETNRSPFDFAEGESELVSGFNVEYSGGGFALIFMAEYSSIMFMSFIYVLIFMGGDLLSFFFFLKVLFLMFIFLWVRGTLPRFRYDKLMNLCWKSFLPASLNFFCLFFGMGLMNLVLFF
uniref:NADH-ubiquinone oxidoreductase chain 1 n=8 Tax=unclassified Lycostomus TaxID=2649884 RepID=A0A888YNF2_9COLE|nr:NADH dehydrogenase subunit 1 [Lycostomus sp. YXY-2021]